MKSNNDILRQERVLRFAAILSTKCKTTVVLACIIRRPYHCNCTGKYLVLCQLPRTRVPGNSHYIRKALPGQLAGPRALWPRSRPGSCCVWTKRVV